MAALSSFFQMFIVLGMYNFDPHLKSFLACKCILPKLFDSFITQVHQYKVWITWLIIVTFCSKYDSKIARFAVNHANGSVTLAAHVTRPVGCSKRTQWVHKLYEALFLSLLLPCGASGAFSIWKRYLFVALSSKLLWRCLGWFLEQIMGWFLCIFLGFIENFLGVLWIYFTVFRTKVHSNLF